jgi:DNA polymerase-3 subunit delta'
MFLDEIIGNEKIKVYLKKALLQKNLPNSLIFSGLDGIGKSLFAKAVAKSLMYEEINENDLRRIEKEIHPDLHVYRPQGKIYSHSISTIRDLTKKVVQTPFEAKSKVFIIHDAHLMSEVSSNAFLKTLEEPNLDSYIILLTSNIEKILPTISSRCSILKFSSLSDEEIIALLQRWGKTKEEAEKIANLSFGSFTRACELSNFVDFDDRTKVLLNILSKNFASYEEFSKELEFFCSEEDVEKRFKGVDILLNQIFMWYRDLYILKSGAGDFLFYSDRKKLLEKNILGFVELEKVLFFIQRAKEALNCNIKLKTVLEKLFLDLKII